MSSNHENTSFLLGSYTTEDQAGRAKGIYLCSWNQKQGRLSEPRLLAESSNPSYLATHPNRRFLYAVNEDRSGAVTAFSIAQDAEGEIALKKLNSQSTGGIWPCYISLDNSGRFVFVANYGSGSVLVYPILADGSLGSASDHHVHKGSGPHPRRQESPHAHMILQLPDSSKVYVVDLTLDMLVAYDFDVLKGKLLPLGPNHDVVLAPAAGPRHFVWGKKTSHLYVADELDGTVAVLEIRNGAIGRLVQTLKSVADSATGDAMSAGIRMHPQGGFLYVSHRAEQNDIAVFSVNANDGTLQFVSRHGSEGTAPRDFVIDSSGQYLIVANQHSDTIHVFEIDQKSGALSKSVQTLHVPTVVNLLQF